MFSVSVDSAPAGRGFSRHGGLSSDDLFFSACSAGEKPPALLSIGSMSPPGYPSAWLRPRSARFRFARQDHCSSANDLPFLNIRLSRDSAKTQTGPDPN